MLAGRGRRGWEAPPYSKRGQALLVAVLVLFAVAALAALFIALIGSQVTQVGRYSEMVELRNIAEAGLNFANEQLTYGIAGADWRPPQDYRFRCGRGEFTLSVDYGPDPARVQSRFVRIVSTASFPDNPFLRHTILALKPVLLTDYARFITDRFSTGHDAALGVPGLELAGEAREGYVFTISGPIRANTDTVWYGASEVNLYTSDAPVGDPNAQFVEWRHYGVLRDDRIEIAGRLRPADLAANSGETLQLSIDRRVRAGNLFRPAAGDLSANTEAGNYVSGFPDWAGDTRIANTWRLLAELPEREFLGEDPLYPPYLAVPRVQPPDIEAVNPDLQTNRYLALTRDSGEWRKAAGAWFNTGAYGWGWTRFGGIYIDNTSEIQYQHDLEKLRRNWVRSVGAHAGLGDQRTGEHAVAPLSGPADWWDKTGHYYAPPGVEIVLHGESACPYLEIVRHDGKGSSGDPYYWRNPAGNAIPRSDTDGFTYQSGTSDCAPKGTASPVTVKGPRALFPFPPNGVIYAEGNVRIRGIMPPMHIVSGNAADFHGYFGTAAEYGESGRNRRYDLTVVSGGTIYVEGDLLGPRSAGMIEDSLEDDMLRGSRVALLARDYVCVNTTALNPRPKQMFSVDADGNYYNDGYPLYPPGGYPQHDLFQGPKGGEPNSPASAQAWTTTPVYPTTPDYIDFVYQNVRLRSQAWGTVSELRLMMGHSALYPADATSAAAVPPETERGSDRAAVDVDLQIGQRDPATGDGTGFLTFPWEHESDPPVYTFLGPGDPAPRPDEEDQSGLLLDPPADWQRFGHWYTGDDYLEFLANEYQNMHLPLVAVSPPRPWVSGDDIFRFRSRVYPVRQYDEDGNVIGWQIYPKELGYVLGPVAVAPGRGAAPLPVQIEALVYAQNGSWFIIPGPWFNEDPDEGDYTQDHPGYHEPLNIRITFKGAITENMPAEIGEVADWTSKWAGPYGASGLYLSYEYDPLLRWSPVWQGSYLRFRSLPMTPDLLVWGERVSGQAGP